jgi:hypothetical protein
MKGCRTSGTSHGTISCWWVSNRATSHLVVASVPFNVATGSVEPPFVGAVANIQAPGLEGGAVRGRGELPIGRLAGNPGLDVVLPGGTGSQITSRHINHPVRQAPVTAASASCQDTKSLVFCFSVRGVDVAKHLELLELVNSDDAPGVFAIGARFSPVTGGEAHVAKRP